MYDFKRSVHLYMSVYIQFNPKQADVTKRYGNLKNGALDIINHPWFKETDYRSVVKYM